MKPGIKTTEFWLTVLSQLIAFATAFGFVTGEQAGTLTEALPHVVAVVVLVANAIVQAAGYIKSRAEVKVAAVK